MIRKPVVARLLLVAWLVLVILLTSLHDPIVQAVALAGLMALSGRKFLHILHHVLRAVLLFNIAVSLGYGALAFFRGTPAADTIILLNLRVMALTWLTFLLIHRVHLPAALSFSSTLTFFLTLAWSQSHLYGKIYDDFRLAMESRCPDRPGFRERFRMLSAAGRCLIDKALHDAEERALSMKSRLFFETEGEI